MKRSFKSNLMMDSNKPKLLLSIEKYITDVSHLTKSPLSNIHFLEDTNKNHFNS